MPSTTFLEDEDKTLVQLAREYTGKGRGRIAWKNVAQKMKRWSRSPAELAHRLNSLKRTFGADLSKFPPSFYTPVRAARGRRNACIVQIRQGRRCSAPKSQQRSQQARLQLQPDQTRSTKKSTYPLAVTEQRQVPRLVEKQDARGTGYAQPVLSTTLSDDDVTETATASSHSINNGAGDCCYRPERDLVSISQTSMSSKDVHHAVIALFEDISQQEVVYPPNAPHLNVGVLLPTGISAFIGAITAGDVFGYWLRCR
ncbi:SANT/Myb domain [Phytophthora cactorum]|nr:SANT/Myb domain [Phytophthora cactorum]